MLESILLAAALSANPAHAENNDYRQDTVIIDGQVFYVQGTPANRTMVSAKDGKVLQVYSNGNFSEVYDGKGRVATINGDITKEGPIAINGKKSYVVNPASVHRAAPVPTPDNIQKRVDELSRNGVEIYNRAHETKDEKEKIKLFRQASSIFEKAVKLNAPNDGTARDGLAACYGNLHEDAKCEQTLLTALKKFPDSSQLRWYLEDFYNRHGNHKEAEKFRNDAGYMGLKN